MPSCGVEGQALTVAPSLSERCLDWKKGSPYGNVAYCGINNIHAFSTLSGFDPDQVHQILRVQKSRFPSHPVQSSITLQQTLRRWDYNLGRGSH